MKKKKVIFIISIILVVTFITYGCKFDSTSELEERIVELEEELAQEEEETSVEKPSVKEEAIEEEETVEEEVTEEEAEVTTGEGIAPTISLAIYMGPVLAGGICYYRVEATVTGSPTPNVSFNRDDSGGAWLPNKVQINLNNPGDTFTLTATATNSEGSNTDSIALSWGCDREEEVEVVEEDGGEGEIPADSNHPPEILNIIIKDAKGLTVYGSILHTDEKYSLFAEVFDEDGLDDILSYSWNLGSCAAPLSGTISDLYSNPTVLLTGANPNSCISISIRVFDLFGEVANYSKEMEVTRDLGL